MSRQGTSDAGSYDFGALSSPQEELARLRKQAETAWNIEKRVLVQAGLRPGMRVLDLACGPGFITRHIAAELTPPGGTVTGVDLSDPLLDVARNECRDLSGVTFRKEDVYALDLPDASFDFVYGRFLFQHLDRPEVALREVHRVLAPGGRVVLVDADDGLLGIFPEPEGFAAFTAEVAEYQRRAGGDRKVGRKLGCYLVRTGFEHLRVNIVTVTSEQLPRRTILDVVTGFNHQLVPENERERAVRTLQTIYRQVLSNDAFIITGVYVAAAVRP
ncbi:MAG: methyltransferase domain-containing protein [Kiritimatiellaeota bacterium]|nr:methyltransferase domain-containing protein [Kiritimatiellota bacterium]